MGRAERGAGEAAESVRLVGSGTTGEGQALDQKIAGEN
jgi:hypothetical protein